MPRVGPAFYVTAGPNRHKHCHTHRAYALGQLMPRNHTFTQLINQGIETMKPIHATLTTILLAISVAASAWAMPVSQKPKIDVWRGGQHQQAGRYVDNGAKGVALELTWQSGSRPLMEVMLPTRPAAADWKPGMEVSLWVRDQPVGGVKAMALRIVDDKDEVYQFGAKLDAKADGWQKLTWTLKPAAAENTYGGDSNKQFDGDARWFGLVMVTREKPEAPVTYWISQEKGGEVEAQAATVEEAQAVQVAPAAPATGGGKPLNNVSVTALEKLPEQGGTLPEMFVDLTVGRGISLIAADRKKQSLAPVVKGVQVREIVWAADAAPLAELTVGGGKDLLAFDSGVTLSIPVNAVGYKGFSKMALRAVDAQGETFQWPIRVDPQATGWQDVRITLDPASVETSYGGPAESKGKIDLPVRLSTIILLAPDKQGGSVKLGPVSRNAFDPQAISAASRLGRVSVDLKRTANIPLFRADKNEPVTITVNNGGAAPANFDLVVTFTHFDGSTVEWTGPGIEVAPGDTKSIEIAGILKKTGWYSMSPALRSGDALTQKPSVSLVYLVPAQRRDHPPAEGFWLGIDARIGNPSAGRWMAELASLIGADYLRVGNTWPGIQPKSADEFQWAKHDAELALLEQFGLKAIYGLTFTPPWAVLPGAVEDFQKRVEERQLGVKMGGPSTFPPQPQAWRNFIGEVARHNSSRNVIAYEIWNEPDLAGFYRGTTDQFIEMMKIAAQEVRANHPQATIVGAGIATMGGHGGQNLNPDLIERSIVEGFPSYDAIGLHQHGSFANFVQGVDGRLAVLRARIPQPKPLWFTETGNAQSGAEGRLLQADILVKKVTFARARGAIGMTWFVLQMGHEDGYAMVGAGKNPQPFPQLAAYNELAKMMRGRAFVTQHELGTGAWVLEFASNTDRLLVLWAEEDVAVGQSIIASVPAGAQAQLVDLMGNAQPVVAEGALVEAKLSRDVRYVVLPSAAKVVASLAAFDGTVTGVPGQKADVAVKLSNPLAQPAVYRLVWSISGNTVSPQEVSVPVGQTLQHSVAVTIPPAVKAGQAAPVVALAYELVGTSLKGNLKTSMGVAQLLPAGNFDERDPDFVLDKLDETIINVNQADPNRAQYVWKGADDLSARIWLMREERGLRMRVDVRDDIHLQPNTPALLWQADSVQYGLQFPGQTGFWEFGLGLNPDGKQAATWMKPAGFGDAHEQFDLQITPIQGGLRYEVLMPFAALGVEPAQLKGQAIRFNVVVNDEDGGKREGWAQIGDGIARNKNPELFPLVIFE